MYRNWGKTVLDLRKYLQQNVYPKNRTWRNVRNSPFLSLESVHIEKQADTSTPHPKLPVQQVRALHQDFPGNRNFSVQMRFLLDQLFFYVSDFAQLLDQGNNLSLL